MRSILVTGGSGTLGCLLVTQLRAEGYAVRSMSRRAVPGDAPPGVAWVRADLETGEGLAEAVQDCDVIVHAASSPFRHTQHIDVDGTRRLLVQARAAAVSHIVYISIVGIDRIPFAYYQAKLAAEKLIEESGIAWSVLRATQFHSLLDFALQAATRLPLVTFLPTDLRFQPMAQEEVARHLCEIVQAGPGGRLPDIGGPQVQTSGELAQRWLRVRNMRRALCPLWLPGKSAQAFRRAYNTCPQRAVGKITWDEWVQQKYGHQSR